MEYEVNISRNVSIDDVDVIITLAEQGWKPKKMDDHRTLRLETQRSFMVEVDDWYHLVNYLTSLTSIANIQVNWAESEKDVLTKKEGKYYYLVKETHEEYLYDEENKDFSLVEEE